MPRSEQVWQGFTDSPSRSCTGGTIQGVRRRFTSDWKQGSTYDMAHEEVGLVVSDPEQVILESDPAAYFALHLAHHQRLRPASAWTKLPLTPGAR